MDRTAFLSSLPYVLPTTLSSWPHRPLSKDPPVEVLLKDHFYLSIEPVVSKPAFFSGPEDDPAMTSIQLALDCRRDCCEDTSGSCCNVSPSMLFAATAADNYHYTSLGLLARIHGRIYAFDVRQLLSVQLEEQQQPLQQQQQQQHKAKSLLLTFSSCTFRIFSLHPNHELLLEQAHKRITTLVQIHPSPQLWQRGLEPYLDVSLSSFDSPSTTTTTASRRHEEASSTTDKTTSQEEEEDKATLQQQQQQKQQHAEASSSTTPKSTTTTRWLERHRHCQERIAQLEQVLIATPAATTDATNSHNHKELLSSLLNGTAEAQTRLYVLPWSSSSLSSQQQQQQQEQQENSLQQVLHDFFPAPRRTASLTNTTTTSTTTMDAQQAQAQVEHLLRERQKAVQERVKLFLLPSRG